MNGLSNNEYHSVVGKITRLLSEHNVPFETFEHAPVRTSEEAAQVRTGYGIEQGAKAIIARVKVSGEGKRFVMFVLPGSKRFDPIQLRALFGFSDIRFATETEVDEITGGVLPGGVPPFGNLFGLDVYTDVGIFGNETIIFNAGDRRFSIAMRAEDYKHIVEPSIASFAA